MPRHEVDEEEFNKFLEWKNTEKKKALIAAILSTERRDVSWGRAPNRDNPITVRQLFSQLPVNVIELIERNFHPENNVRQFPAPTIANPIPVNIAPGVAINDFPWDRDNGARF